MKLWREKRLSNAVSSKLKIKNGNCKMLTKLLRHLLKSQHSNPIREVNHKLLMLLLLRMLMDRDLDLAKWSALGLVQTSNNKTRAEHFKDQQAMSNFNSNNQPLFKLQTMVTFNQTKFRTSHLNSSLKQEFLHLLNNNNLKVKKKFLRKKRMITFPLKA